MPSNIETFENNCLEKGNKDLFYMKLFFSSLFIIIAAINFGGILYLDLIGQIENENTVDIIFLCIILTLVVCVGIFIPCFLLYF